MMITPQVAVFMAFTGGAGRPDMQVLWLPLMILAIGDLAVLDQSLPPGANLGI